jgi:tripartite ATP-independent transporter DctP family solute receptor
MDARRDMQEQKMTRSQSTPHPRLAGAVSRRAALKDTTLAIAAAVTAFHTRAARAQTVTMRVGSDVPIDAPHTVSAVKLKENVEKLTDGRVKVEIFPNSQLGDSTAMTVSVKSGTLDAVMTAASNLALSVPSADVFNLPFLFKDAAQALQAANGAMGAALKPKIEAAFNCEVIGFATDGSRNLWDNKRPIRRPEDMQGLKMRGVAASKILRDTYLALGAIPTPLSFPETYTGLQTGVIDGGDMPVLDMVAFKLYQVTKYLTLSRQTSPAVIFIASKKFMDRLSPADRQIVRDSGKFGSEEHVKAVVAKEAAALEELKQRGVQVFELEDRDAFVAKVQPVLDEATARIGSDILDLARAASAR